MQAFQVYPSHPALLRHQSFEADLEDKDIFRTPEKRTRPRNMSPPRKPTREDLEGRNFNEEHSSVAVRLFL